MSHDIPRGPEDDRLDRALAAMRDAPIADGPPEELVADTLAALRKAADEQRPQTFFSRMMTMKTIPRVAAGLLVAVGLAVLATVVFRPSVSFAQVFNKIAEAKTMTFTATTTLPPGAGGLPAEAAAKPITAKFMVTSDGRMRIEGAGGSATVIDQKSGKMLQLDPTSKRATVVENMSYGVANNPVEEFKKLTGKDGKAIGEKEVGGRVLKGFVASEKNQQFTVWADKSNGEPVTIETTVPMMGGRGTVVMSDFVFDPKLDDALFSLEAPQG